MHVGVTVSGHHSKRHKGVVCGVFSLGGHSGSWRNSEQNRKEPDEFLTKMKEGLKLGIWNLRLTLHLTESRITPCMEYLWSLSRILRNRQAHALNGNTINGPEGKKSAGNRVKDLATSSFAVGNQEKLNRALRKLCHPKDIIWCPRAHCDRFDGKADGIPNFIVFW